MSDMATLRVHTSGGPAIRVGAGTPPHMNVRPDFTMPTIPDYEGPYSVTPSGSEQVLQTGGLAMLHDVVIAPIPSNYGLITWNGSHLMVS